MTTTPCGIFLKFKLVVVIAFDSHDTTFATWHIFTCHNTLQLFKNSNTTFHIVAVSLMPQPLWSFFLLNERFLSLSLTYTGCPRRNVPDFGRVFLMLKYTDITQNTYVQSGTVTEIMAREK